MKTCVVALCLLLSSCSLFKLSTPTTPVKTSVVDDAMASVVELYSPSRDAVFCTGAITHAVILTAAHCVDPLNTWLVRYNGELYDPEVVLQQNENDLAVIRLVGKTLPEGRPLSEDAPVAGQTVVIIGHPYGFSYSMSVGIVSYGKRLGGPQSPQEAWVQIDARVAPGSSGSPVFNQYGEILGIITFTLRGTFGGAIHVDVLRNTIGQLSI